MSGDQESPPKGGVADGLFARHASEIESAIQNDAASFDLLVVALYYSQAKFNPDEEDRARYEAVVPRLHRAFEHEHGRLIKSYSCSEFLGSVAISVKEDRRFGRPRQHPELHILFNILDSALDDDESEQLADLLYACQRLAAKANQLLSGPDLLICLDLIYWLVGEATARLNQKLLMSTRAARPAAVAASDEGPAPAEPPSQGGPMSGGMGEALAGHRVSETDTSDFGAGDRERRVGGPHPGPIGTGHLYGHLVDLWRGQFRAASDYYYWSARRGAEISYLQGMAWGLLGLVVLGAAVGAILSALPLHGIPLRLLVGSYLGGAIGAMVSVMTRITSGRLDLNIETGRKYLSWLGVFRPVIGTVFGLFVYFVLASGLLRVQAPGGATTQFFFFTAFAFIAGFSERFAQDILGRAEGGVTPAPPGGSAGARGASVPNLSGSTLQRERETQMPMPPSDRPSSST